MQGIAVCGHLLGLDPPALCNGPPEGWRAGMPLVQFPLVVVHA